MNAWISDVKNAAFRLESSGVAVIDEDVILALTAGLPESFSTFIVALNNLPTDQLTLPNVITCLLNEEVRQDHPVQSSEHNEALAVQVNNDKRKTPLSEITCYNCSGKGHYKSDCPSAKIEKKESASTVIENEEDKEDFEF